MHYILIDHENVQPADLAGFDTEDVCVMVFTGSTQKVAISLIIAVQNLGERGRFIKISGTGKNALDFHIAYYLGQYCERDPQASFLLVSLDKGYDPLIEHLITNGFKAKRISPPTPVAKTKTQPTTISTKPAVKKAAKKVVAATKVPAKKAVGTAAASKAKIDVGAVIKKLKGMPKSRPLKESTLKTMINAWSGKTLDLTALNQIVAELEAKKVISISEKSKVTYSLPD